MAESKEELKSFLMKVKDESDKADLQINIKKMKIMASSPITSWQIEGGKWKQWQILFSWYKNHCRWLQSWNQKMFAPWEESYDKPTQHIKKLFS